MATAVGGAFLSTSISIVLNRLTFVEFVKFIRGKKLDDGMLQRLKHTLYAVEALLNDAEQKQITSSAVKEWLDDLRDAVYHADDLLDVISTEAVQKENKNVFSRYVQDREMVRRFEVIVDRLQSIFKLKDILGLKELVSDNSRLPSTSIVDGSTIYGRDQDREALLKLLLEDDECDGKLSVIPIFGMAGVGKTSLAQLVYNDDLVYQKFDSHAWAYVSDEFDILKVTKTITGAFSKRDCSLNDINLLHVQLKEMLIRKKFLLVLDDIWIEDYAIWNFLLKPLHFGTRGSKIIVTTRSEKVASLVQTFQGGYHLKQLSDDDCWSVFVKHAQLSLKSVRNTAFEKIGRQIVGRCQGSPLAALSLGGALRGKHDIEYWNSILNSNIWEVSENERNIIAALRISYNCLAPHLKRCFLHCSLFPKDYVFLRDELILLWMAEDLIVPSKSGKTLEEVGCEYFYELASRSLFQCSSTREDCYVMNDLFHDLATLLSGEFYCRTEVLGNDTKFSIRSRHLSFHRFSDQVSDNFEMLGTVKILRTFLPTGMCTAPTNTEKSQCNILSNLKCLRALSFSNFCDLMTLPDSLGKMLHLRYLDLSNTNISTLPDSLCNLFNLQTLKLFGCVKLERLPKDMPNLINLRHIDIRLTGLKEMPGGMGRLNQLHYLSCFIGGKHEEQKIKELGKLLNLHGPLEIQKLENVTNTNEALEARLMDKKHLDHLALSWSFGADCADSVIEMNILCKLQPHQELKSLEICSYRGTKFPEWIGDSSYHTMNELSLSGCKNCCMLPSLGQLPCLKRLRISDLNGLEAVGIEFYKNDDSFLGTPFPSLEHLKFENMPYWEVWHPFESNAFPELKLLEISD